MLVARYREASKLALIPKKSLTAGQRDCEQCYSVVGNDFCGKCRIGGLQITARRLRADTSTRARHRLRGIGGRPAYAGRYNP